MFGPGKNWLGEDEEVQQSVAPPSTVSTPRQDVINSGGVDARDVGQSTLDKTKDLVKNNWVDTLNLGAQFLPGSQLVNEAKSDRTMQTGASFQDAYGAAKAGNWGEAVSRSVDGLLNGAALGGDMVTFAAAGVPPVAAAGAGVGTAAKLARETKAAFRAKPFAETAENLRTTITTDAFEKLKGVAGKSNRDVTSFGELNQILLGKDVPPSARQLHQVIIDELGKKYGDKDKIPLGEVATEFTITDPGSNIGKVTQDNGTTVLKNNSAIPDSDKYKDAYFERVDIGEPKIPADITLMKADVEPTSLLLDTWHDLYTGTGENVFAHIRGFYNDMKNKFFVAEIQSDVFPDQVRADRIRLDDDLKSKYTSKGLDTFYYEDPNFLHGYTPEQKEYLKTVYIPKMRELEEITSNKNYPTYAEIEKAREKEEKLKENTAYKLAELEQLKRPKTEADLDYARLQSLAQKDEAWAKQSVRTMLLKASEDPKINEVYFPTAETSAVFQKHVTKSVVDKDRVGEAIDRYVNEMARTRPNYEVVNNSKIILDSSISPERFKDIETLIAAKQKINKIQDEQDTIQFIIERKADNRPLSNPLYEMPTEDLLAKHKELDRKIIDLSIAYEDAVKSTLEYSLISRGNKDADIRKEFLAANTNEKGEALAGGNYPIFKRYDDLGKFLKKEYNAELVEMPDGRTWYKITLTPEEKVDMKNRPMMFPAIGAVAAGGVGAKAMQEERQQEPQMKKGGLLAKKRLTWKMK